MNPRHATNTLNAIVAAIAIVGLMAVVAVGNLIGVALLIGAALLTVSQRTQLARSIRVCDTDRRHHRLKLAAVFAALAVADTAIGFADLANEDHWGTKAVIYGAISYAAAGAAICYLVAGLLTRKGSHGMTAQPAMR